MASAEWKPLISEQRTDYPVANVRWVHGIAKTIWENQTCRSSAEVILQKDGDLGAQIDEASGIERFQFSRELCALRLLDNPNRREIIQQVPDFKAVHLTGQNR